MKLLGKNRIFVFVAGIMLLMLVGTVVVVSGMFNRNRADDKKNESENISNNYANTQKNYSSEDPAVTSKGYSIEEKEGVTYIDGIMIVNKTYALPSDYEPSNTHKTINGANSCQECLIEEVYEAYSDMKKAAANEGINIWISSGYRSYTYQNSLYQSYVNKNGKTSADTFSARPGHSEHQSGYAFDLNTVSQSFADTKEGQWVNQNAYRYGFILRYPEGKEDETGYIYEPWHFRYVGRELANKLYNDGDWLTLEDYFGITSTYKEG